MITGIREKFNAEFTETRYNNLLNEIWALTGGDIDFRISETPLFIDEKLSHKLIAASNEIINQINSDNFRNHSLSAIPGKLFVPNEASHPKFFQIDFAIVKLDEEYEPQLIELQGFPSLYAFQVFLDHQIRKHFAIPGNFSTFYNGLNYESYVKLFRKSILGDNDPEATVLLEVHPHKQKTKIDFILTEQYTGIDYVDAAGVYRKGKRLYIKQNGKEKRIERIYNRVIFDELINKGIELNFNVHDDLDVEWIGHPNWFFKLSKHTIPYLKSKYVPSSFFLNDLEQYPDDLENFILKPLYSFAGSGVKIDITKKDLDKITNRENYILMEKIEYAPLIKTPDEFAKAEIRLMFLWDEQPLLVNNLLRVSKGKMMGVDYNKNKTWVGASTIYHPINFL